MMWARPVSRPGPGFVIVSVAGFLPVIALNTYSAMLTLLTAVDSFRRIRPTRGARVAAVLAISGVLLACALLAGAMASRC